jgi:hypothetical protein
MADVTSVKQADLWKFAKEQRYILAQDLLEKSKLAQQKATKFVGKKRWSCRANQAPPIG